MCAAPGNKTTHMANLMKNKGRIYAVERNAERYKVLCENSTEFGVIKTINDDCLSLTEEQVPGVEYILLDPSCSGSGRMNQLNEEIDESRLYKLQGLQYKLLKHALTTFPSATRIVYSTCSLREEENEKVVQDVLRHCPNFKLVNAGEALGMDWKNFGSSNFKGVGEKCLYARPEVDLTDGMFVAVLERCGDDEVNEVYAAHEKQKESYDNVNRMMARQGKKKDKKRRVDEENNEEEGEKASELEKNTFDVQMKKRKKKETAEAFENGNEEVMLNTESSKALEDENVKDASSCKKKKKNKNKTEGEESLKDAESVDGKALEDDKAQMNLESINGENGDAVTHKKKKKSKNEQVVEDGESLKASDNIDNEAVSDKKKKKKKKNRENEEAFEIETIESNPESTKASENGEYLEKAPSKKKSKRKTEEAKTDEQANEDQSAIKSNKTENVIDEFLEKPVKKKKKQKLEETTQMIETEEPVKKKKNKSKDLEIEIENQSSETIIPKKKKKSK